MADHYLIRNQNGAYYNRTCCTFQERLYATRMAKSIALAEAKFLREKGLTAVIIAVNIGKKK